MINIYS